MRVQSERDGGVSNGQWAMGVYATVSEFPIMSLDRAGSSQRGGKVRIIGGMWRRRMLNLPRVAQVRPTPDRVRETLFNWLAPFIAGTSCLDAFAGSGALGFEAASRGASRVRLLDTSAEVVAHLREQCEAFDAQTISVEHADAVSWLERPAVESFDAIFIDPPFDAEMIEPTVNAIAGNGWLASGGVVFIEAGARAARPELPVGWAFEREKRAGRVRYYLASRV